MVPGDLIEDAEISPGLVLHVDPDERILTGSRHSELNSGDPIASADSRCIVGGDRPPHRR
jgi:hypothetical protein